MSWNPWRAHQRGQQPPREALGSILQLVASGRKRIRSPAQSLWRLRMNNGSQREEGTKDAFSKRSPAILMGTGETTHPSAEGGVSVGTVPNLSDDMGTQQGRPVWDVWHVPALALPCEEEPPPPHPPRTQSVEASLRVTREAWPHSHVNKQATGL